MYPSFNISAHQLLTAQKAEDQDHDLDALLHLASIRRGTTYEVVETRITGQRRCSRETASK